MRTQNKDKIEKAALLFSLIQKRLELERQEKELKEYFKDQIIEGVLEAGPYLILKEKKSKSYLDRGALLLLLGDDIRGYEKTTEYDQLTVKRR